MSSLRLPLLCFSLLSLPPLALAQDGDPVLPYRPSVASPAQLPVPGQLEFEAGGLLSKTDDTRRASLPYTFKLAFTPEWGVLLEGEGIVRARDETGRRETGLGDTTVVLKRAFELDSATALGLELGWKLATAKDAIGSGKSDVSLNGIVSRDLGAVHMDVNLNATRLGASDPATGRVQTGWAASFSTPVSARWGATAEVSGTHLRGAPATAQLLLAATYSPTPRLAVDIGMARGLTASSPDWSLFSGLVVPLGKLW